ncbi:acyl-CoA thioesterase [Acinetobacter silvestris]|uniref:Thioesterase n=1 Tax=Acinetobacter silvestris TaxID=1977882 RepID=A0A1Y3CNM4_9GAMM|nr:thioesterase family protein [Acinetobacter silvestris]OTG67216.1 thioesterase [Acinetobacter silvestris]
MDELLNYPVIYEQKVAWGDMDAFGHVNNVIYYRYMESARIAYFDQLNIFAQNIYTVVSSNQCQYLKPVVYPDHLKIGVRVNEIRNSAIRMHYVLWSEQQNAVVATGDAVIVFVDPIEMKKTLIPVEIKNMILTLEQSVNHELS